MLSSATIGGVYREICSLIVTVSNSDQAREIINAKIVWKKLTISQVPMDLATSARLPVSSTPAAIMSMHFQMT